MANVLFVPRYKKDLAEGKLFDSTEYQPRRQKYAVDRPAYNSVKKMFTEYGHSVYTADQISLSNVDIAIFIDLPRLNTFGLLREISTIEGNMNLIYIMREPPSFLRYNSFFGLTKISSIFDIILTWNNDISSISDDFEHYYIPWNLADKIEAGSYPRLSYNQRDLLTNISGKHTSDHPNELYSERKRVIEYYEDNYPEMFSLYGGWQETDYGVSHGSVNTKAKPYGSHRFALCFESMTGISGWVTEKIFDCFIHDTVPVYWGANDIQEHVPTQSFIDYREYPSPEQLHDRLVEMERSEYRRMRAAGKEFVHQCDVFKPDFYASRLLKLVNNILNSSQNSTISEKEVCRLKNQLTRRYDRLSHSPDFSDMSRRQKVSYSVSHIIENPAVMIDSPDQIARKIFELIR